MMLEKDQQGSITSRRMARAVNPLARTHTLWSLLRFTLPSIGMMLVISLYTVVDGIFIGQYAGANAIAASNIAYPGINLVIGLAIMIASGGSALVAKTLGEKDQPLASRRFTMLLFATLGIDCLVAALILLFLPEVLAFLGATPLLYEDARLYLGIMTGFAPFLTLLLFFNYFYIVDGAPKLGFAASTLSGLLNGVLDYVFLAHFHWGIAGAAFATGIGYCAAAAVGLVYFTRYAKTLHFVRPHLGFAALRDLGQTMSNGSSELVTELAVGFTTFLFNLVTFHYAGEDGIAAITVILYTEMLMTSILMGFSTGIAPVFSYQFGAKNGRALRRLMRQALKVLALFGLLSFGASQLFGDIIVRLFLPQGGHVAEMTRRGFLLYSFSFLLVGFNLFTSGFFTAISEGLLSALSSFIRNLAAIAVFLIVLPRFLGLTGVWLAVPAADLAAVLLNVVLLFWTYDRFRPSAPRPRGMGKRRMAMQTCPEN